MELDGSSFANLTVDMKFPAESMTHPFYDRQTEAKTPAVFPPNVRFRHCREVTGVNPLAGIGDEDAVAADIDGYLSGGGIVKRILNQVVDHSPECRGRRIYHWMPIFDSLDFNRFVLK